MSNTGKKRVGFVVGNYHTDHPSRLVHIIWELFRNEDVELQVFLGTESASFMKDFAMRSNLFDYQYASLCAYSEYEDLDLLIISAGTLSIYQNSIPLDEFLRHIPPIPLILMETDRHPENGISLIADNEQGISSCVEHLITVHGKTRIGFITGPKNNKDADERFDGYRNTLTKHGIPVREEYIGHGDYSENVDRVVEQLLDRAPGLEAIVSSNDEMTVAVYRVLKSRGLTVGKDIAVTGFDDMQMARYMDPPLTTARQDYDEISRIAVESALKIFRGEEVHSRRVPVPFIRRCSCGCTQAPEETDASSGQEELVRNIQRSREYQHNSWIGSLMNRELLLEVNDSKRFFTAIGSFMAYLGVSGSSMYLFDHPLRVRRGTIPDFPEKIYLCMRQTGNYAEGYDWDEAPVLYKDRPREDAEFQSRVSYMTFLLFDEKYQYGVLNVQIEPDKIDFCYMLSLDIGTSLRYMDLWAQQKQYRAELQAMASTDALTGLLNRAGVIRVRERMTGKTSRLAGVIMADLDHLKQINDTFGHNAGDIALTTAAEILKKSLGGKQDAEEGKSRPDEKDWVLGRVGGDEYMACFVNVTKEELEERIRRMHGLCDEYNQDSGQPFFVEISAGVAMGRVRNMEDWSLLTTKADEQLYEAKKGRREFVIREGKV